MADPNAIGDVVTFERYVPASAATVDVELPVGVAPFAGFVSLAQYIPVAAITGANTNNRTIGLRNRAADATGVAVPATETFSSGVNASAYIPSSLTLAAAPASGQASPSTNYNYTPYAAPAATAASVAAGDVITFTSIHLGTGLADPGGLLRVQLTRNH